MISSQTPGHGQWTLVVLLALLGCFLTDATLAKEPLGGVAPFSPAVVISGTARERGIAYGKQFRDAIHQFYEVEILKPFTVKPASKDEMIKYATACGAVIREECPMIALELEGIAEGAELSFAEIVLINLHEELYHRRPLPMPGHCTAVSFGPQQTGNGHTYVGQTWDWMQSVAGKSSMLEWQRDDGVSVLAYGFPGMPFGAGLNSKGIALCWTSAALGETGKSPRVGLPSYVLIAHLLNQPDLESVLRVVRRDRHAGWFTFVMADRAGNLVNIEGSPDRVTVETTRDPLIRVGYGTREMTGAKSGSPVVKHARCELLNRLLDGSKGHTDEETLQRYFADPNHKISVGKSTIDMMIFNTTTRTARLSRGPDYGESWKEYRFTSTREP